MGDRLARQRAATYRFWREDVTRRPQGEWAEHDGVQMHTTGLQPRHWNGAFLTSPAADLDATLAVVAAWFRERDKPWGLLIPAETDVVPAGLQHAMYQPVMLRDLDDVPAADTDCLTIRYDAPAADVARVQAEAFEEAYDVTLAFVTPTLRPDALPPQRTVTAYEADQAVGCATVATMDDVAGIFGVAVRPEQRRAGLGTALTAVCMQLAAQAGCDLAFLNPSPIAHGLYARLGFEDALPFRVWVPGPAS